MCEWRAKPLELHSLIINKSEEEVVDGSYAMLKGKNLNNSQLALGENAHFLYHLFSLSAHFPLMVIKLTDFVKNCGVVG